MIYYLFLIIIFEIIAFLPIGLVRTNYSDTEGRWYFLRIGNKVLLSNGLKEKDLPKFNYPMRIAFGFLWPTLLYALYRFMYA